jgi:hypothetical protein
LSIAIANNIKIACPILFLRGAHILEIRKEVETKQPRPITTQVTILEGGIKQRIYRIKLDEYKEGKKSK